MTTIWIYVDTRKEVGDADTSRCSQKCGRRGNMVRGKCPEGVAFEYEVLK
jgi:hypothetical protein